METQRDNFFLWGDSSKEYFDISERVVDIQWNNIIIPFLGENINTMNSTWAVDLACGRGRWTEKLKDHFKYIYAVDVNYENVKYCLERFKGRGVYTQLTDGYHIPVFNESAGFIFCFDAMVHFDEDVIINYLKDAFRVLEKGGKAFFHHSNYYDSKESTGVNITLNPHWRNIMTQERFKVLAEEAGFTIEKQEIISWGDVENLDCLTLLKKEK